VVITSDDPFTPTARKVFSAIYLLPGLSVKQVAAVIEVHPSTVSHHLPTVDNMALISSQWRGSERLLTPAGWTL
jgi:DNA-binding transcriptional ArsR family regulator